MAAVWTKGLLWVSFVERATTIPHHIQRLAHRIVAAASLEQPNAFNWKVRQGQLASSISSRLPMESLHSRIVIPKHLVFLAAFTFLFLVTRWPLGSSTPSFTFFLKKKKKVPSSSTKLLVVWAKQ